MGRQGPENGEYSKEVKQILEEKRINITHMVANDKRIVLTNHEDFKNEKMTLSRKIQLRK